MSKEENNDANQELRELLQRRSTGQPDDFEKEALEGYAMLDSEDDALKLKTELDHRMARSLGESQNSRPRTLYWIAAACVLFITSYSFYYILTNNAPESELAVREPNREPRFEPAPEKSMPAEVPPAETPKHPADAQYSAPRMEKKSEPSARSGEPSGSATTASNKASEEELNEDRKMAATMPVAANSGAGVTFANENQATDNKEMAAQPSRQMTSGKITAQKYKGAQQAPSAVAAPAAADKNIPAGVTYLGGQDSLNADLAKMLEKAGLNRQFNAVIHFTRLHAISQVEITDPFGLDQKQQDQVKKILGDLRKFNYPREAADETLTFLINYRP
jgi:hypothetical protein